MNYDQEFIELLDKRINGTLTPEEAHTLDSLLASDTDLAKRAEEHEAFVEKLKTFDARRQLKATLEELHADLAPVTTPVPAKVVQLVNYRRLVAIAASVVMVSIAGAFLITRYFQEQENADYHELRRNVEKIQRSQNQMAADLVKAKKVLPGKYAGTGFLIAANGYVVTSYHVVREADSVIIENETLGRMRTSLVFSDPANDVSILRIESERFKNLRSLPYTIAATEASLGEGAYTLGFPREDIVYGEGSVSANSGYHQNPNAYQISIPVNPGNSGGPLLNSKGDLIGIISAQQTETTGAAFAIKSAVILKTISEMPADSLHAQPSLARANVLRNLSRVEQIKRWREMVVMVRVYK